MSADEQRRQADAYSAFREGITRPAWEAAEPSALSAQELPSELELQHMWLSGLLGREGDTCRHGHVRILDFGTWNRGPGPDFLACEIELNGRRLRGDIELDPTAQDWERHGHGGNPAFNNVILHIILEDAPAGWYTRNANHYEVPVLALPADHIRECLGKAAPVHPDTTELCRKPLAEMPWERVDSLLRAGAAFRVMRKRRRFRGRAECVGLQQAWYESWAETLGYRPNKVAMQMLAGRAPLSELKDKAESVLFGTAGFLVAVLPEKADEGAREYHREVWDSWWPQRDKFELSHERKLPWVFAPLRPVNHPHRRVAALAVSAQRWKEIGSLLNVAGAKQLARMLTSLRHPYWDWHCSLVSKPTERRMALVGEERVQDFIVNHLYVQDDSPAAWAGYLALNTRQTSTTVLQTAQRLFGDREDVHSVLNRCYVQQALLQIQADFCASGICQECLFPAQLSRWGE